MILCYSTLEYIRENMNKLNENEIEKLIEDIEKIDTIIHNCVSSIYSDNNNKSTAYTLELCCEKLTKIKDVLDKSLP